MNDGRIVSSDGLDLASGRLGTMRSPSSRSRGRTRSRRVGRDGTPVPAGPDRARGAGRRPRCIPVAAEALRATGLGDEHRGRTSSAASWRGRGAASTRSPRRSTSSMPTGRRTAPLDAVDGRGRASRPGRPRHRAGSSSIATRSTSDGLVRSAADRAADEPEPGGHRGTTWRTFAPSVLRPAARGGDASARAAHPQLRPVHQLRDPLPGPARRGGVEMMRSGDRARVRGAPARRRRRRHARSSSTCRRRRTRSCASSTSGSSRRITCSPPMGRSSCSMPSMGRRRATIVDMPLSSAQGGLRRRDQPGLEPRAAAAGLDRDRRAARQHTARGPFHRRRRGRLSTRRAAERRGHVLPCRAARERLNHWARVLAHGTRTPTCA